MQLYLVNSMYEEFLCTTATKEGKNIKPTVIPSKSHSAAVFISKMQPKFYFHKGHRMSIQMNSDTPPKKLGYF
jgi:hypothetical protein